MVPANTPEPHRLLIGLGETLFDCFPDKQVLGGAPLNVAIHAHALLQAAGGAALPVTRIGDDDLGKQALESLRQRGLSTEWVQVDGDRPTGRVRVTLDKTRSAHYEFEKNSAWDAIAFTPELAQLAARCDAVAFGTLAQRSPTSRETIQQFLQSATGAVRLFDVNLRQQYYDREILHASFNLASTAKVNEEELRIVLNLVADDAPEDNSLPDAAEQLRSLYDLDWLAVTRGPEGVALAIENEWIEGKSVPLDAERHPEADTVGAGDACCAALLVGTLQKLSTDQTLALANACGAHVASQPGATPSLPESILRTATPSLE
ncbi:MAG: PfkB family carbohydrate kinase [Planctomycetota bacterium]